MEFHKLGYAYALFPKLMGANSARSMWICWKSCQTFIAWDKSKAPIVIFVKFVLLQFGIIRKRRESDACIEVFTRHKNDEVIGNIPSKFRSIFSNSAWTFRHVKIMPNYIDLHRLKSTTLLMSTVWYPNTPINTAMLHALELPLRKSSPKIVFYLHKSHKKQWRRQQGKKSAYTVQKVSKPLSTERHSIS